MAALARLIAAIYARFSSENQRDESIEDQVAGCRRHAGVLRYQVPEAHVYVDRAQSGADLRRPGLLALMADANAGRFQAVIVDDLSRLSRDSLQMLMVMKELECLGIRVVAVADNLDSSDEDALLPIHFRGLMNELYLSDLKKKTFRGQLGQKNRGFTAGERTYGYRSYPHGEVRIDKRGRPRPAGYKQRIEPAEAAVVRRIFEEYAAGRSLLHVVQGLNDDGVPLASGRGLGWSSPTVQRILANKKYIGTWVWNRMGNRRDPLTGRIRRFKKPESEHHVTEDESLRIIPQALWDTVRARHKVVSRVMAPLCRKGYGGPGRRTKVYPKHLLDGLFFCSVCGGPCALVGGQRGGYYGCIRARRHICDNRLTVGRKKAERILLGAIVERLVEPGAVRHALRRVSEEVARLAGDLGGLVARKQAETDAARLRLRNLVSFVGLGKAAGSVALADEIVEVEARVSRLDAELAELRAPEQPAFPVPSEDWVASRVASAQQLLERRTSESAALLRQLLGKVVLEPVGPDPGRRRRHYLAHTALDTLALLDRSGPRGGPDGDSPAGNPVARAPARAAHPMGMRALVRPRPAVVRTEVRDRCDGGGGGSRTRVREYGAAGFYMRSRSLNLASGRRRTAETAWKPTPIRLVIACRWRRAVTSPLNDAQPRPVGENEVDAPPN